MIDRDPLPRAFRPSNILPLLTSSAAATAIAAGGGAFIHALFATSSGHEGLTELCCVTTLVAAGIGVFLLRFARTAVAVGASIVLAMANCSFVVMVTGDKPWPAWDAVFGSAIFGSAVWIPALLVAWLAFGLPIKRAKSSAPRGPTLVDHREALVGRNAAAASVVAFAVLAISARLQTEASAHGGANAAMVVGLGGVAMVFGSVAMVMAGRRKVARERFVDRLRRGEVPGLRIEEKGGAAVVVRHVQMDKGDYRAASVVDEELAQLDDVLSASMTK